MPVRKIPKNYRNVTGVAASSKKAVGDAQFESTLERDYLRILEFAPDVSSFEVQPVKIEWLEENGSPRSYTPDVLVKYDKETGQRPMLCEVKYRADIKKYWTDLHPKFLRAIRLAKQKDWCFRLITEVEIRTQYLKNIQFLARFLRIAPDCAQTALVLDHANAGEITPAQLMSKISHDPWGQAEWMPVMWHLIATRKILTNLDLPLTMDSKIWSAP